MLNFCQVIFRCFLALVCILYFKAGFYVHDFILYFKPFIKQILENF